MKKKKIKQKRIDISTKGYMWESIPGHVELPVFGPPKEDENNYMLWNHCTYEQIVNSPIGTKPFVLCFALSRVVTELISEVKNLRLMLNNPDASKFEIDAELFSKTMADTLEKLRNEEAQL